jgi:hypothetical protein
VRDRVIACFEPPTTIAKAARNLGCSQAWVRRCVADAVLSGTLEFKSIDRAHKGSVKPAIYGKP